MAQKIDKNRLADKRLYAYFALLKAKLLLLLGYEQACLRSLGEAASVSLEDRQAALETRYLQTTASLELVPAGQRGEAFDRNASYADLAKAARAAGAEGTGDFYELEALLFAPFRGKKAAGSKTRQITRGRQLAKNLGDKTYLKLLIWIHRYVYQEDSSPEAFNGLKRRLERLSQTSDHRLFQVLSLLCADYMTGRQHYKRAGVLLSALAAHWARLEAGFPQAALRRLAEETSHVREFWAYAAAALPEKIREEHASVADLLLSV
jgi:hypothetical protein